jgi:PAS domain S-box-containing protein
VSGGPHPAAPLSAVVDSARDAIVCCSAGGTIVLFNSSSEQLYGLRRDEVAGRNVGLLFGGASTADATTVEHLLARDGGGRLQTTHRRPDGSLVAVEVEVSPIVDREGGRIGTSLFARDISERLAVARELARTRRLLEEHADELARSNAELEQFAYVASHDLSEPLRTITGMLGLLQDECSGKLGADADEYIARAVAGTERLRRLIDDLLSYSRVGRRQPAFEAVDLAVAVAEAVEGLGEVVGPDGRVRVMGDLPVVEADPGELRQVIANLVSNALKFNEGPEPRVVIEADRQELGWRITVADNGIGIRPEHADRIFRLFKRLHTRDAYPGTGIGLALCQRIIERRGGRIEVEEHDGDGARIAFTVPDERPIGGVL